MQFRDGSSRCVRGRPLAPLSGVYVIDGPEALSRGASVRIALEGGGNARTMFAPPAVQGASIEDIANVRY